MFNILAFFVGQVQIFWEGHNILRNLHYWPPVDICERIILLNEGKICISSTYIALHGFCESTNKQVWRKLKIQIFPNQNYEL